MLTNKTSRFAAIRTFMLVFSVLFGLAGSCIAQQQSDELTAPEMLAKAREFLRAKNYDEAIDYMMQYLDAIEGSNLRRVLIVAQDTRYKLATILISQDRKEEAIPVLEKYVSLLPAKHVRKARKMLVACYFDVEKYKECIPAVTNALYYNERPLVYTQERRSAMDREVESTFLEEGEEEEPDLPYSMEELVMLQFTMGECYYNLGINSNDDAEKETYLNNCMEPFTFVVDNTENQQRKGYSIM